MAAEGNGVSHDPMQEDAHAGANEEEELAAMKARLAALEEEKRKIQEHANKEAEAFTAGGSGAGADGQPASDAGGEEPGEEADEKAKEADGRSVYVGNVDYECSPEELQEHFKSCGTLNRVTILTDKFGNPKGFAYVEFAHADSAVNAVLMNGSMLRDREIKVAPKRTNVPGLKEHRGRGRGRGPPRGRGGFYGGGGYYADPYAPPGRGRGRGRGYYDPYAYGGGYGYAPRGRGRGRGFYAPY